VVIVPSSKRFAKITDLEIPLHLGWRDLRSRYAQTKIGPWWSASSLLIIVIGISLSVGLIGGSSAIEQAPRVAVAMGIWTFVSGVLTEATDSYVSDRSILLNTTISDTAMTLRLLWRNYLVLLHNSVVMAICLLVSGAPFLAFPKLAIVILCFSPFLAAVTFVPAYFFSRFGVLNRDLRVFLGTAVQLNFFLTPILWDPPNSGPMHMIFLINPAGWFIQFSKEFIFTDVFPSQLLLAMLTFGLVSYAGYVMIHKRLKPIKKYL
jgi:lipopolysaccharide transport system permease protein